MQQLDRGARGIGRARLIVAARTRNRMAQSGADARALGKHRRPHGRREAGRTSRLLGQANRVDESAFDPGRDVHAGLPNSCTSLSVLIDS
jgi:hypothetical protein